MVPPNRSEEERLDSLFQAYRDAFPEIEPGAGFMPEVWQKIESRRSFTYVFRRIAGGFVTAALAMSLAMAVYLSLPSGNTGFYSQSYVETLADSHTVENLEFFDQLQAEGRFDNGQL